MNFDEIIREFILVHGLDLRQVERQFESLRITWLHRNPMALIEIWLYLSISICSYRQNGLLLSLVPIKLVLIENDYTKNMPAPNCQRARCSPEFVANSLRCRIWGLGFLVEIRPIFGGFNSLSARRCVTQKSYDSYVPSTIGTKKFSDSNLLPTKWSR